MIGPFQLSECCEVALDMTQAVGFSPSDPTYTLYAFDDDNVTFYAFNSGSFMISYSFLSGTWRRWPASSGAPPARSYTTIVFARTLQRLLLFGGYSGTSELQDTWSFNPTTGLWVEVVSTAKPPGRWTHAAAFYDVSSSLLIFGGYNGLAPYLNDLWQLTGALTWAQVGPVGASPPARNDASMAISTSGVLYIFGGTAGASSQTCGPSTSPVGRGPR